MQNWKKSSPYFKSLPEEDKKHYKKKLTLSNGDLLPDPYSIENGWESDVTRLPDVSYPDIYSYLIETPSDFTKDKLKAYKSLEAYNFFVSGHVQDVYIRSIESHKEFSCIKTSVLPSQRQGQNQALYEVWVILHSKGWILCGNCTCMAGLGSACSHLAALLFKLQASTQLELNKVACTSKLCAWKKSRKRAHPAPLKNISFKRPKKEDQIPNVEAPFEGVLKGFSTPDPIKFSTEKQKQILMELKKVAPKAAVFTSISLWDSDSENSDTDTADENDENTLPELLTSFFDPSSISITNKNDLQIKAMNTYKSYLEFSTEEQYLNLARITASQSSSNKWMLYRAGRITASNCKKAFVMDINRPAESTIKTIMHYTNNFETKETKHGKQFEPIAVKAYLKRESNNHNSLKVTTTGLNVNHKFPFLGASPDGIVTCDCHGKRLLEIKCPFKFKKGLSDWKSYDKCPVTSDGQMKTDHEYYFQMQLQMLVTEINECDFFVWSQGKKEVDTFMVTVQRDNDFCQKLKEKLENVFKNVLLPELLTRKLDPNNHQNQKLYCYCKRPSFKPMIGCDSVTCKIEWFHYACVNVVRAPPEKKKWYCPDCAKKK